MAVELNAVSQPLSDCNPTSTVNISSPSDSSGVPKALSPELYTVNVSALITISDACAAVRLAHADAKRDGALKFKVLGVPYRTNLGYEYGTREQLLTLLQTESVFLW